ncbi:hypothetical protein FY528_14595 [Hymenobacter lutimineralis]|uniref:Uncharacterized protein n=1 Tax=Hymenobacter lutimineralis TaxID=2606448 RepID=A0A5D6UYI9_9BACT|nr:hypothetical protein [Hymenobacter lutimineralis]TYZ07589.1 hypothetical protein FY528_14595 [Hymenobacter lutimineralis]
MWLPAPMNLRMVLSSLLTALLLTAFRAGHPVPMQLLHLRCELLTNAEGIKAPSIQVEASLAQLHNFRR